MRISDAKFGDVLRDKDGDVWCRTVNGAEMVVCDMQPDGSHLWVPLEKLDARYGPFVRLVPEKEGDDAK